MPRQNAQRIRRALDSLAANPERREIDIAPVKGRLGNRPRVGGNRILFERDDEVYLIDVLRTVPRGQAYRQ